VAGPKLERDSLPYPTALTLTDTHCTAPVSHYQQVTRGRRGENTSRASQPPKIYMGICMGTIEGLTRYTLYLHRLIRGSIALPLFSSSPIYLLVLFVLFLFLLLSLFAI
jgi:hypothetical protein